MLRNEKNGMNYCVKNLSKIAHLLFCKDSRKRNYRKYFRHFAVAANKTSGS